MLYPLDNIRSGIGIYMCEKKYRSPTTQHVYTQNFGNDKPIYPNSFLAHVWVYLVQTLYILLHVYSL